MDDEVPILDEENYSTWRIEMRVHLREMRADIWKAAIGGSVSLKNKSKYATQREEKKNDALALKTILSGLSSPIKENMGQCTSTKDLCLNLEETYQSKKEKGDIEERSINIIKGKEYSKTLDCIISKCDLENISSEDNKKEDLKSISNEDKESPKTLDCNDSKCNDDFFSTSEEENLETVCVQIDSSYPMERIEEDLLEIQKENEEGLYKYSNDHYYMDYNYLSDNTKKFHKKSQRHILKLREMLKEQEKSNKTQLEEKEEEITRLKNER
jgi:hypothetical protein